MCVFGCGPTYPYEPNAGEWKSTTVTYYEKPDSFDKALNSPRPRLTQAAIDAIAPPLSDGAGHGRWMRAFLWLERNSGPVLTIFTLICFLAGAWGCYLWWSASQAVNTAVRG